MTGFKSKKNMARDKLAHMTFEERCRLSEQCLPDAPYREMLTKLHDEMLKALAQPEPVAWHFMGGSSFRKRRPDDFADLASDGLPYWKPLYTTPPQRTWVGLTAEEAAECWTTSATQTWKNFEAKFKQKNT